ncbi:MAG: hypothetical protein V1809_01985, partial [Planctomycetota bacterium]
FGLPAAPAGNSGRALPSLRFPPGPFYHPIGCLAPSGGQYAPSPHPASQAGGEVMGYVRNPTAQDPFDQTFNLDKLANWTSFVEEGTTEYRTHSIANELTARDSTNLTHDANGNQTSDGTFAFEWDGLNRQKVMRNGSTLRAEYFYTADNRRVVKNIDTNSDGTLDKETRFYFDGNVIIEDRDSSDALAREYVNGLQYIDEVILVKQSGGTINYYLHDPRFSVFGFTDTSGSVTERYNYTAYGKQAIFDASYNSRNTPTVDQERGHTGQTEDREGPLQNFRNRPYHAGEGRFISRDWRYFDGMNLYKAGYVPSGTDPSGLLVWNKDKYIHVHVINFETDFIDDWPIGSGKKAKVAEAERDTLGMTIPRLNISVTCVCRGSWPTEWYLSASVNNVVIKYYYDMYLTTTYKSDEHLQFALQSELEHVADFDTWEKTGKMEALKLEREYFKVGYLKRVYCENAISVAFSQALVNSLTRAINDSSTKRHANHGHDWDFYGYVPLPKPQVGE